MDPSRDFAERTATRRERSHLRSVGSASDVAKRLAEHGGPKGAKFTRDHPDGRLIYVEGPLSITLSLQRERQLKRWSRAKKLALIRNQTVLLKKLSHSTR
jgi:putative endonuclease